MKMTEQTTLAELATYLAAMGDPFVTLMKGLDGERHVVVHVTGTGTFLGDGETVAQALEAAFSALRQATLPEGLKQFVNAGLAQLPPLMTHEEARTVREAHDEGPQCEAKGQCEDVKGDGACFGCGRWLGDELTGREVGSDEHRPETPRRVSDDVAQRVDARNAAVSKIGMSLAEQTQRVLSTLTPREREALAMRQQALAGCTRSESPDASGPPTAKLGEVIQPHAVAAFAAHTANATIPGFGVSVAARQEQIPVQLAKDFAEGLNPEHSPRELRLIAERDTARVAYAELAEEAAKPLIGNPGWCKGVLDCIDVLTAQRHNMHALANLSGAEAGARKGTLDGVITVLQLMYERDRSKL